MTQQGRARSFLATIVGYLIVIIIAVVVFKFVLGTIFWLVRAFFIVIVLVGLLWAYLRLKSPD